MFQITFQELGGKELPKPGAIAFQRAFWDNLQILFEYIYKLYCHYFLSFSIKYFSSAIVAQQDALSPQSFRVQLTVCAEFCMSSVCPGGFPPGFVSFLPPPIGELPMLDVNEHVNVIVSHSGCISASCPIFPGQAPDPLN